MSDIDHLLRRDAEQWNARRPNDDNLDLDAELDAALRAALHRPRGAARARLLATAAAVLAIVTLAVTVTLIERGHSSAPPAEEDTGPLVSTRLGNLVIRHPADWRYVPREFTPLGVSVPLGWLTNQTVHRQCTVTNSGRSTTCHSPVVHLTPGGVYLAAIAFGPVAPPLHNAPGSRIVFGLTKRTGAADCPAGTTDHLSLIVTNRADERTGETRLVACTSHPSKATTAAVKLALTTVHVHR